MYDHGLLAPVLALVAWTFVMSGWLLATRLPAMQKAKIDLAEMSRTGAKLQLPPEVMRVSDNYNHLHEAPTIFYATALAAQVAGVVDATSIGLAWGYVVLRVAHSFVQATVNFIPARFVLFLLSQTALFILLVRTVLRLG